MVHTTKPIITPYEWMLIKGAGIAMLAICVLTYALAATVAGWGA
jgi:hypothetical protein